MYLFQDRQDAGSELAQMIIETGIKDPLIFALTNGGVPVASVISHELGLPFEVLVTRNVGYPGQQNFLIGAMTEDEKAIIINDINFADPRILEVLNEEKNEIRRKIALYRQGHELPEIAGRAVIMVDDGLTNGASALAAAKFLKERDAKEVILAIPVAPENEDEELSHFIDRVICPHRPADMNPVGKWYQDFCDVTDGQVLELLGRSPQTLNSSFWTH